MLTKLHLVNFKSWEDTGNIPLRPLTGLFGLNSSGKTSLLQALLLFKQTADSPDRSLPLFLGDARSLVDFGTFEDVICCHDLNRRLQWEIEWQLPQELIISDVKNPQKILFRGKTLTHFVEMKMTEGSLQVERTGYRFHGVELGMKWVQREQGAERGYELFPTPSGREWGFKRNRGRAWPLPPPNKFYGFPDEVRAYYQNAQCLSDFELEFERLWTRLYYLGPLREYPHRQYLWAGGEPLDVGRRGERVVEALLASRHRANYIPSTKQEGITLEQRVARWLHELGLIEGFQIETLAPGEKLYRVSVQSCKDGQWVALTDVGFGVSQVLPVITLCYYVPEGSVIILEQPEIHLHPSVQAGLADVLIDAVKTRHIQVILESHSEHLLRRLQRRIAENQISHEPIALYFVKMENGISHGEPLQLNVLGNIQNWPEGFFGDEFGEIAAMQEAILSRKNQEHSSPCQTR